MCVSVCVLREVHTDGSKAPQEAVLVVRVVVVPVRDTTTTTRPTTTRDIYHTAA